jgi:protein-disulfide isomerase
MKKLFLLVFATNMLMAQTANLPPPPQAKKPPSAASINAATRLPSKDEVEVAMKRSFGYDRSLTWTIYDIRPSPIPALADVLVSINKGAERGQPQHIYVSAETQNAIGGEMIPFGSNPFAPVRAKLQAADGPATGAQAPVILVVEFSDLECPHCKAAQPIIEKLVADFPQVRYIFQQFPLPAAVHPWAMKAAEYSDCAAQLNPAAFWKYTDSIFENQGSIALATADDKLKELAAAAGLDAQKISACAVQPQTEARVKKSLDLGEFLDVTQTPTLFLNGRRVLGIADIPYPQLKNLVQFEIDHAEK